MNQDAGSALIQYGNGAHAAYVQNFLPRLSAGHRGATVIGYAATLRFDWQTDTVTVIDHHRDRVDRIAVAAPGVHGGGDEALARNFVDVVRGRDGPHASLADGLLSAAVCLAARDAANLGVTRRVPGADEPGGSADGRFPRGAGRTDRPGGVGSGRCESRSWPTRTVGSAGGGGVSGPVPTGAGRRVGAGRGAGDGRRRVRPEVAEPEQT